MSATRKPRSAVSAIPTEYRGINFRSRLEAKWAFMFDVLRWRWEYEPFDMQGYIPDFLLLGSNPVLVEIKPVASYEEAAHVAECIPHHPSYVPLVLGASPHLEGGGWSECAGALGQWNAVHDAAGEREMWIAPAIWSDCTLCPTIRLVHDWGSWADGNHPQSCGHRIKPGCSRELDMLIASYWANGANLTQWNPPWP